MTSLNLPEFNFHIKEENNKKFIFDEIRKKYVILTPEEWVRQNFSRYMIEELGYPRALIKIESGHQYHKLKKRSDLIVYNRSGEPLVLVEFKSPDTPVTQKTFEQISVYNQTLRAKYLVVTNGLKHYCWYVDFNVKKSTYLESIPDYNRLKD